MAVDPKKLAAAYRAISKGFAALADAYAGEDEDDDDVAPAKSTKTATASKKASKQEDDDDDDDSEDSPKSSSKSEEAVKPVSGTKEQKQALAELAKLDVESASRLEMKPIAEALGLEVKGVVTEELQKQLQKIKDNGLSESGSKKSAQTDEEDDEEEEAPKKSAKSSKAKVEDDDEEDDDDEEVEFPDKKTMKADIRLWAKAHRKEIIAAMGKEYFDEDDDAKNPAERLHQTLADLDTLKEQWKDNVAPLIKDGSWKKIQKKYAETDDDE